MDNDNDRICEIIFAVISKFQTKKAISVNKGNIPKHYLANLVMDDKNMWFNILPYARLSTIRHLSSVTRRPSSVVRHPWSVTRGPSTIPHRRSFLVRLSGVVSSQIW